MPPCNLLLGQNVRRYPNGKLLSKPRLLIRLWELSFDARMWARQRTPALGGAGVQPL